MTTEITGLLREAVDRQASDIYMVAGRPLTYKIQGRMVVLEDARLDPAATEQMIKSIYLEGERDASLFLQTGDDDFSFTIPGVARFRVSAFKQRSSFAAVIRVVKFNLPDPETLGIPNEIMRLGNLTKGLVLVAGPAGSGKSTTLACLIDHINQNRSEHIITLEDPLEYLHRHNRSIVSQREIPTDTESYAGAMRAAIRQSPDVIMLSEMHDPETISLALTAAESGILVISSLYAVGAAPTISRIIDAFPPSHQHQIRVQLSMVLQAVVTQQLLPTLAGEFHPAFEIMLLNGETRNMIRDSRFRELDEATRIASDAMGMTPMDDYIFGMYLHETIDHATAVHFSMDPDAMEALLGRN